MSRPSRRFAFRLALATGEVDVDAMLARIPSRTLTEWQAYYLIEPFGAERGDLQAGIVASTFANVMRDPKKGRVMRPGDFALTFELPATAEEIEEKNRSIFASLKAALMGGTRGH